MREVRAAIALGSGNLLDDDKRDDEEGGIEVGGEAPAVSPDAGSGSRVVEMAHTMIDWNKDVSKESRGLYASWARSVLEHSLGDASSSERSYERWVHGI